ncbi:hypothetical protein LXL04_005458 [Taraxacum kok-saghyz]
MLMGHYYNNLFGWGQAQKGREKVECFKNSCFSHILSLKLKVNMHRQSLGSPASKLHSHGVLFAGAGVIKDDINTNFISEDFQNNRKDKLASSSAGLTADEEEHKSQKPYQPKSILAPSSTRLVHLIPLLTFICFLVLYLSSHDPSRKDLAAFSGFTTLSSKKSAIDSIDIDNVVGGFLEIEKNDVLAIRSMRNLQQQQQQRHRLHRKFGH